eukprot:m.606341 g.606341  ORF g.606341 m.606341 type:complete len:84 (+) comp58112_c1_seq23:208-459(+)
MRTFALEVNICITSNGQFRSIRLTMLLDVLLISQRQFRGVLICRRTIQQIDCRDTQLYKMKRFEQKHDRGQREKALSHGRSLK